MTTGTYVEMLAGFLWRDAVTKGGSTRALDHEIPDTGYVVGRPPYGDIVPTELSESDAVDYVAKWLRGLPTDAKYVGIWRDEETGLVHLDVVDIYAARHDAHGASVRRGEIAYYSLHEGREYRVEAGV